MFVSSAQHVHLVSSAIGCNDKYYIVFTELEFALQGFAKLFLNESAIEPHSLAQCLQGLQHVFRVYQSKLLRSGVDMR